MSRAAAQQDVRVLVVDDHPGNLTLAGEVVEATEGFAVAGAATTGEEALRVLETEDADVVLMDVRMPGAGGVVAARAASALPSHPLVVLVSADEWPEIEADPSEHGAAAFVRKETLCPRLLRRLWERHEQVAKRN